MQKAAVLSFSGWYSRFLFGHPAGTQTWIPADILIWTKTGKLQLCWRLTGV